MLERHQEIRKHSVYPLAGRIIALIPGDMFPFSLPAFMFYDTLAIIPESEAALFALCAQIFTAVR